MLATDIAETVPHTLSFDIFPVIHLRDGQVVDFTGQNPDESAIFDAWQPLETAKFWIAEGARWIHIVDIDAMFRRESTLNWALITQICELPVSVQLAAGHLDSQDVERAFQAGVSRVLLDASQSDINALASTALASHGPDAVGVIFTTHAVGQVGAIESPEDWPTDWAAAGGEEAVTGALQLYHLGITTGVHATVANDGSMSGCDLRITQELASLSGINFLAGGEVYDMDDVVSCYNRKGVTGVLIGRALYNGTINLERALRITRRKIAFESGLPAWKREQESAKARLRYAASQRFLLNQLPDGPLNILDAGGGNGQDALVLAEQGHKVTLLDDSSAMLADFEQYTEHHPAAGSVTTQQADIRDIPRLFDQQSFDVVLCHNVIQYVTEWEAVLASATRPLKKGGMFSLIARNRQALPYQIDYANVELDDLDAVTDSFIGHSSATDSDVVLFTPRVLQEWLLNNKFENVQQFGILCLPNYAALPDSSEHELLITKLEKVEQKLGAISPHRDVARYVQMIAIKQ